MSSFCGISLIILKQLPVFIYCYFLVLTFYLFFIWVCRPYDVHHVTVMPCYDKKLEAVRDDFIFSVDDKEVTEVDSVLTTGEVLDLIQVANAVLILACIMDMKKKNYGDTHYDLCVCVQSKPIDFKTLEESSLDRL